MPVLPEALTLRDGQVVLREWREDDAPALKPVCGDPEICRFTSVPWTYSIRAAREWVQRLHDHRSAGTGLALAITRDGEDSALGNVNLVRFNDAAHEAALGYWLVPAARGQGLAAAAARMLSSWGFDQLSLVRIELALLPGNLASRRVAERLGAECEGVRRMSREGDARPWDMLIYSLRRVAT